MSLLPIGGGKLPGKTEYAGRRRAMTRTSGFKVHDDTTGGEFRRFREKVYQLEAGEEVVLTFQIAGHQIGDLLGFGAWFWHTTGISLAVTGGPAKKTTTDFGEGAWNKLGSIWKASSAQSSEIVVRFLAKAPSHLAVYQPLCGRVVHSHYEDAPDKLMKNMFETAPEAVFIDNLISATVNVAFTHEREIGEHEIILKSCNRCGRYLPINVGVGADSSNERRQLSFTNHCVAEHRRPCKHATFGRLRNIDDPADYIKLSYGYQLECRFCKKFEVNAAHNPQRTSGQMKEDAARRRAFELLLESLYQASPQMLYRHKFKSELAEDTWKRFNKKCFNCSTDLVTPQKMHLDHTRPLAFLWPLDETATALCGSCNSQKRDRMPAEFYTKPGQLEALANITGIPLADLQNPTPNEIALDMLVSSQEWLFTNFLARPEMTKEREGKIAGELVVKALQRVLARSERHSAVDLQAEYEKRRQS